MARRDFGSYFLPFVRLPAELRRQIWSHALPEDDVGPALHPYKDNVWQQRKLRPGESPCANWQEFCAIEHAVDETLEFRHDLLDQIRIDLPLVKHAEFDSEDPQCRRPSFTRPFDSERDVLYVDAHQLEGFNDRAFLMGIHDYPVPHSLLQNVSRIAVPASVLDDMAIVDQMTRGHAPLGNIWCTMDYSGFFFVLPSDGKPEFEQSRGIGLQPLWTVRPLPGSKFIWNEKLKLESIEEIPGSSEKRAEHAGFQRLMVEVIRVARRNRTHDMMADLTIRPAMAVKW